MQVYGPEHFRFFQFSTTSLIALLKLNLQTLNRTAVINHDIMVHAAVSRLIHDEYPWMSMVAVSQIARAGASVIKTEYAHLFVPI